MSEETKTKISNSMTGRKASEEAKSNMRKPKSEDHKNNMSKPKSEDHKTNIRNAHLNSKRTKQQRVDAAKKAWETRRNNKESIDQNNLFVWDN